MQEFHGGLAVKDLVLSCCGTCSIPGPGNFMYHGCGKKKKRIKCVRDQVLCPELVMSVDWSRWCPAQGTESKGMGHRFLYKQHLKDDFKILAPKATKEARKSI